MATRKLKFKPKPVVGGAVRRPREKEEVGLLEFTSKDPNIKEEPLRGSIGSVTNSIKDNGDSENINDITEESVSKKLRTEPLDHTCSSLDPPLGNKNESVDIRDNQSVVVVDLNKINSNQNISDIINRKSDFSNDVNINPDLTDFSVRKLVGLGDFPTVTHSSKTDANVIISPVCSQESNNEISSTSQSEKTPNLSQESSISLKSSDKTETGKVLPRFGRSKFKPVLNNAITRKKVETKDSIISDDSGKAQICPATSVRTESVIKSVKSEINKPSSIVSEITESFSTLESDETDIPLVRHSATPQPDENDPLGSKFRFDWGTDDVRNTEGKSNINSNGYLERNRPVQSSVTTGNNPPNNSELSTSIESCEMTDRSDSNQLHQILDNTLTSETVNSNAQISTANKVPISPIKSTSKILVPKPSPNLLDTGVRRISFHGSDSEEESKRKIFLKSDKSGNKIKKDKDVKTNKRKLSQGSTYSKLGQEALEKFARKFGKADKLEPTEKAKLTMLDLIFYNPKSNPMSASTEQTGINKKEDKFEVSGVIKEALAEESVDDVEAEAPAPAVPVPQLKVGPDGQIILDPQSLVIETTEVKEKRAEMEKSAVVRETGITRYNTYSKKKHIRRDWTAQETLQFYKALNTIGSDFTLMTKLFPNRSRHELKLKFKKEEKTNMKLVDLAMTAPTDFDFSSLEEEMKQENEEIARTAERKRLAAEAAKKERAMRKEEKEKNKRRKPNYHKLLKVKDAAFKDFDESEIEKMKQCNTKKAKGKKKVTRKKKVEVMIPSSSDEEDSLFHINIDSDEADMLDSDIRILDLIKEKTRPGTRKGRKIKQTKKLEEYEEINETLKRKLEEIETDSSDGYTPNGPGADMLFGSPVKDPFPDSPGEKGEGSQWNMEVTPIANVDSTVFNTDVENASELGSLGQNMSALDLSLPLRTNTQDEAPQGNVPSSLVINRHLISESIQIIDQLTTNEHSNIDIDNRDISKSPAEPDQRESQIPLPSFESVSRSRPPVVYSIQEQFTPTQSREHCDQDQEENNLPFNATESDHRNDSNQNNNNQPRIVLSYYRNETDECILGD